MITCIRCGTCCSKYQPRIDLPEARTLAEKLDFSWEDFLREYTDPNWPGVRSLLIKRRDGVCSFLQTTGNNKQRLCRIHSIKPACCRDWKPGLDLSECQQGLSEIWDLKVDSSGNLTGTPEKIKEFQGYLESLTGK